MREDAVSLADTYKMPKIMSYGRYSDTTGSYATVSVHSLSVNAAMVVREREVIRVGW